MTRPCPPTAITTALAIVLAILLVATPAAVTAAAPSAAGAGDAPGAQADARKGKKPPKARFLTLRKAGITATRAQAEGKVVTLSLKNTKAAAFTFEVMAGKKVVAKAKRIRVKGAKKAKIQKVTLNRAPTGKKLKLRVTARIQKDNARGNVPLRLVVATGPGGAAGGAAGGCVPGADTDGDGVTDCQELQGFDFRYFEPAAQCTGLGGSFSCLTAKSRRVTSDPNNPNTDGDAVTVDGRVFQLTDGDEWRLFLTGGISDPSNKDSDADGLPDVEEILRWGTLATSPDSDGDSGDPKSPGVPPNAELFDKAEVDGGLTPGGRVQTSPTANDTDGDAISDLAEVLNGTINPVIADVPNVGIAPKPGSTFLVSLPIAQEEGNAYRLTAGTESATDTSDERVDETTVSERNKFSADLTVKGEKGKEAGKDKKSVSAELKLGYEGEWSKSKTTGRTVRFDTSTRQAQEREFAKDSSRSFLPYGQLSATFAIRNESSDFSVLVKDIDVTASFRCVPARDPAGESGCGQEGKLVEIPVPLSVDGEFAIPPASSVDRTLATPPGGAGPDGVPRQLLKQFMANPNAVSFRVSKLVLQRAGDDKTVDELLDSPVRQSTAAITIDDGDGNVRTFSVAAGVGRTWGAPNAAQAEPKPIGQILREAGVSYETGPGTGGRTVLTAVNGKRTAPVRDDGRSDGAWIIIANAAGFNELDFESTRLTVKDSFIIAFVKDADGDGLFDREEKLLGTDDTNPDSDNDRAGSNVACSFEQPGCLPSGVYASDYFESQIGWMTGQVTPNGTAPYPVRSNPATCDGDGDGSPDGPMASGITCPQASNGAANELARLTDPDNPNTDGDFDNSGDPWLDGADPAPLAKNPAKGFTTGTWFGSDLIGGTPNPVFAIKSLDDEGSSVTTPPFKLCQAPGDGAVLEAPTANACLGATGWYKATWVISRVDAGQSTLEGVLGRFTITAGRPGNPDSSEVLLRSDLQGYLGGSSNVELYFKAGAPLRNVRLAFERRLKATAQVSLIVSSVNVEPVASQAAFFGAAGTVAAPNRNFHAIAIPGKDLLPGAAAAENSSQSAALAARTANLPTPFRLPALVRSRLLPDTQETLGRFQLSLEPGATQSPSDQPSALVALYSGTGTPPAPLPSDDRFVDATDASVPLAYGRVYPGDVTADGSGFNVVSRSRRDAEPVTPVVYRRGAQPLRLDNVVIQRLDDARGWVGTIDSAGNVANARDGVWSGYGVYGRANPELTSKNDRGSDVNQPGTAVISQSKDENIDLRTDIKIDPDTAVPPAQSPTNWIRSTNAWIGVQPRAGDDRPQWSLVMRPNSIGAGCSSNPDNYELKAWVLGRGADAITSSWRPYVTRKGPGTFGGTNSRVIPLTTQSTLGSTNGTTGFGYYHPPCHFGGSLPSIGLVQALVTNHPQPE